MLASELGTVQVPRGGLYDKGEAALHTYRPTRELAPTHVQALGLHLAVPTLREEQANLPLWRKAGETVGH